MSGLLGSLCGRIPADLSTDLKLQNAFIRRGIACEQSNLMTYDTHEKIRHAFMAHMARHGCNCAGGPRVVDAGI